jgi:hypothetical protein
MCRYLAAAQLWNGEDLLTSQPERNPARHQHRQLSACWKELCQQLMTPGDYLLAIVEKEQHPSIAQHIDQD